MLVAGRRARRSFIEYFPVATVIDRLIIGPQICVQVFAGKRNNAKNICLYRRTKRGEDKKELQRKYVPFFFCSNHDLATAAR